MHIQLNLEHLDKIRHKVFPYTIENEGTDILRVELEAKTDVIDDTDRCSFYLKRYRVDGLKSNDLLIAKHTEDGELEFFI